MPLDQALPSGVNIVKGEIHRCMTAMRSNQRWASDARFRQEVPLQHESSLLRGFKSLHQRLQAFNDLGDVDTVMYLTPFLDVIVSDDTRCVDGLGFIVLGCSIMTGRCTLPPQWSNNKHGTELCEQIFTLWIYYARVPSCSRSD